MKLVGVLVFPTVNGSYWVKFETFRYCPFCLALVKFGEVSKTGAPVPFGSSAGNAARKFALLKVDKSVDTPAPKPDTPVEMGKLVQFVRVPEAGVPKIGVVEFVISLPLVPEYVAIWFVFVAPAVLVTKFVLAIAESVNIFPPPSTKIGIFPAPEKPAFVTTFAATTPESVTALPLVPEKLVKRPETEPPELVTTFAATTPESATTFPVALEKLATLPLVDAPLLLTTLSASLVTPPDPESVETLARYCPPSDMPPDMVPPVKGKYPVDGSGFNDA